LFVLAESGSAARLSCAATALPITDSKAMSPMIGQQYNLVQCLFIAVCLGSWRHAILAVLFISVE
jgi:hypothetical protein